MLSSDTRSPRVTDRVGEGLFGVFDLDRHGMFGSESHWNDRFREHRNLTVFQNAGAEEDGFGGAELDVGRLGGRAVLGFSVLELGGCGAGRGSGGDGHVRGGENIVVLLKDREHRSVGSGMQGIMVEVLGYPKMRI